MKYYTLKIEEHELLRIIGALNANEKRNIANKEAKEYSNLANELIRQKNSRLQP